MASKKKKKFSEQVLQGEYKSSLSRESVAPALKKTNASVTKAYAQPEEKKWYQEFLKTSKTFSDGYDVGDVSKAILGTATDIENKLGKGFLSIFEAPVDIGTYATSTVLDVFGADKQAEKVKKFGQRNLSEELADKYTKEASILATGYNTVSKTQDDYKKVVELYKSGNIEEGREATKKMLKDAGSGLLGLVTGGSVEQLSSRAGLSPETLGIALDKEKLIEDIDNDSISGDTLDQVAELVGYMTGMGVATSGLNAVTGTAKVGSATTGASVSGGNVGITVAGKTLNLPTVAFMGGASGGLNEAYQKEDVTHAQAWTKGLTSGAIEGITEGMFGVLGVGGNELTDQMATKLAKKFSSSFGKQISNMAVKGGGEAFEELASYTLNWLTDNNVIDKMEGADFSSEFDWEEASEQMALALISGGVLQGSNTALHVNAEANNIINQIEQETGRPLTREERRAIRSETAQKVIELQNDESLQQGLTEEAPVGENVQVQTDEETRENLVKQLKETKETKGVTTEDVAIQDIAPVGENVVQQAGQQDIAPVVEQTGQQVNEADLKRRNYTYVASETDSQLTRELKESASRVMNDTKRSHEFVETVSKIAERTQTKYRFTNTEELNALGYGVEGRRVNGLVTKNGEILINIDSQKALNTIIGHETTHLLEGTKEYKALQDAVFKYAQTKGDFVRESDRMSRIYAGQKNVNIDNELTSELVGDYLFTDQQFLNDLASEQPSIVRKIYNEIKHWIKMATAGSKEARQLEDLKYRFEKALNSKPEKMAAVNETKQTTTQETKDKSVVEVESNTQEKTESVQEIETEETSKVSENVETETKIEDNAEEYSLSVDNKGRKLTEAQEEFFEDSVVRDENGNLLTMYHGTSSGGYTIFDPFGGRPGLFGQGSYFTADNTVAESYTQKGRGNNKQIYEVYLNITKPIDMDGQANVEEWKQYFSKHIPEATFPESGTNEALYRFTLEEFENTEYDRVEVAEIMVDTFQKMGYDGITHIGGGRFNQKDDTRHRVYITFESNQIKEVTNKNPTEDSDIRYSLSETTTDNQGRELTKEQQEYFKDSKARDENGNLLTLYHTTDTEFTEFDVNRFGKNTGGMLKGIYLATEPLGNFGDYTIESYVNITNPATVDSKNITKEQFAQLLEGKVTESNIESAWRHYQGSNDLDILYAIQEQYRRNRNYQNNQEFYDNVKRITGYDGVIYFGARYYANGRVSYVAFNSNQIKNVDNTNPTDSDDIRYSLSEENTGYHYGDLGKARDTNYFSMSSTRRSTGHFGTGTYFVGKDGKVGSIKEGRPAQEVDFSEYNLFKPGDRGEAEQLHSLLKDINNQELDALKLQDAEKLFNKSYEELYEAYKKTIAAVKEYNALDLNEKLKVDSLSTVFMKELGFNGIDVRGIEGFDNGSYGSVIYDLDNKTLTDNEGRELSKEKQEQLKDSKFRDENGNIKVMYHGTKSEFDVFDINKAGGNYGSWSRYGKGFYFTDKRGTADFWASEGNTEGQTIIKEKYLNATNPFVAVENYEGKLNDLQKEYGLSDAQMREGTRIIRALNNYGYDSTEALKKYGFDGVEGDGEYVVFDSEQIIDVDNTTSVRYSLSEDNQVKNVDNINPTKNDDTRYSLSELDEDIAPVGNYNVYGSEVGLQQQVEDAIAPLQEKVEELTKVITDLQENIAPATFETAEEQRAETQRTLGEGEAPLTEEGTFTFLDESPIEVKNKRDITYDIQNVFNIKHTEAREIYNKIANMPELSVEDIYTELEKYKQVKVQEQDDYYKDIQNYIKGTKLDISEIKKQITDYDNVYRMANMGKGLTLANSGQSIDSFYQELNELYPNVFPDTVTAEADQLDLISQVMFRDTNLTYTETLDDDTLQILAEKLYSEIGNRERYKSAEAHKTNWFRHYKDMLAPGEEAPIKTDISYENYVKSLDNLPDDYAPYLEQAREIDASKTEQTAEDVSITNELNRLDTQMKQSEELNKQKALEYLERLENEPTIVKNPFDEILDNFLARARRERTQTPVQRVEKSKLRNALDTGKRLIVNEMAETDNLAHETGNLNIKFKGDMLNSVAGEIEGEIYTAQTDNYGREIGTSLNNLFRDAKDEGMYEEFNHYLELYSNIDRHKQGKGSKVSLAESEQLVKAYDQQSSLYRTWAKDVWQYGENILDNLVDAGLIDKAYRNRLREMYPHYVPYVENRDVNNYYPDLGEIKSTSVIKRAKGGASNLLPIEEALTKYTFASKKAVRQNQFYQEIVSTLEDKVSIGADVRGNATDLETSLYRDETGNYLTAYFNGQQQSVRISDDLYTGLKNDLKHQIEGLEQKFAIVTDPVQKLSEIRRNLLTSWNPMFIIRNPLMDIQDAVFNSKYTKDFVKHYNIKTFMELGKANTETARQFLTLYGSGNVMGEFSSDGRVKNAKFLKGIQRANNVMELAPRFAEFKASLDNGASIQEAMYNAREVTTNFSRGGTITKALNKNGFTFLNVSVQGFDKFIRNFSGENGAKGVVGSLLKAVTIGVLPALFNELAFGGDDDEKDEDYDALPDYIKDNYYLIKTGDGEFIRIPKGRILSVFGSAARRTLEYLQGEEDAFEGFLKNANSQIGVSNPLDSNILTPLFQAFGSENGEAWYGGDIVPKRLQDKAPEEQYDASTDKFSIWLGDKIGVSPYKINYVLDQYSGGIGDIFLPMITDEATNDAEGPGVILAPIKDAFTSNSTFDNKYAGDIYDLSDKMDKLPTATKETDEYKIQDSYLYSVTSEMAELYAERREVQANKNLSKKEKYARVQAIQEQINSLAKEGLDNYQNVSKTDNYAIVGGREFNKYTTDSGEERWGAVFSDVLDDMNSMGMDIEEKSEYFKATSTISSIQSNYEDSSDYVSKKRDVISIIKDTNLNDEQKAYLYDKYYGNSDVVNAMVTLDVDIDSYLDYESQNFEADKNSSGKSISGSKKRKVFDYINSMDIDFEQRVILAKLQYPSYDEYNAEIVEYLNSSDMTYEQEIVFLKKLGFTVDEEGYIYW